VDPPARELRDDPQSQGVGHGGEHRQQLVGGQFRLLVGLVFHL
jgi:hypothetical protein